MAAGKAKGAAKAKAAKAATAKGTDFAALTAEAEKRALAAGCTVLVQTDLATQLVTRPRLDWRTPCLLVDWVDWESGFRDSGVRPGDRVVAVEGKRVRRPATPEEAQKTVYRMVGQYGEAQGWVEEGVKEGDRVTLSVLRRAEGGGWDELDLGGELRGKRIWTDADGRRLLGPLGPDQMADDGFSGSWFGWYESAVRAWTPLLDGWSLPTGSSRMALDTHLQDEKRVRALAKRYPGPFGVAALADWSRARDVLDGRPATLDEHALDFRRLAEQRADQVREAGRVARAAWLKAHKKDVVPAFPAVDPKGPDRTSVAGRVTELPPVGNRDWVGQGTGTIFVLAEGGQQYFAAGEGPAVEALLRARLRYEEKVVPSVDDAIAMVGRITDETALMVVEGRALWGLMVEPVAASLGAEACFVDLAGAGSDPPPAFAGEDALASGSAAVPADDAPPEAVLAAAVEAVKLARRDVWEALYADWRVYGSDDGRPVVSRGGMYNMDSNWEQARRELAERVADVRVRWVDDVVPLVRGDEFDGAPKVDQVEALVDHLRQVEGAEARTFGEVGLHSSWTLQRWDGGPWRITSNQAV